MGFWFKKSHNNDNIEEYDIQPLSDKELEEVTGGGGKTKNGGKIVPGNGLVASLGGEPGFPF